ncbi:MAG: SPOR domain-containing protein [Desulfuromonadales bacterium]
MRIDYREPKKTYTAIQTGQSRPKTKGYGALVAFFVMACLVSSGIGFGSGWWFAERSVKKGFKKAMEQQSLENSPRQPVAAVHSPPKPQIVTPQAADVSQQPQSGGGQTQPVATGAQTTSDPPLSFYKNLPSGQKSNVLGSGINAREGKTTKQPLQAAIPANLANPAQPQTGIDTTRPPTAATAVKTTGHEDVNSFTVQIASLSLKSEAEALKSKMANKGYNVYISESNQGNKGTWYRVRVGKGLEPEAARELAGKLGKGAMAISDRE